MASEEVQRILRNKSHGIFSSIEKMGDKEKQGLPSQAFGENYNSLLSQVSKTFPELSEYLPPAAKFDEYHDGTKCVMSYSEIHTYCNEIYNQLS